MAAVTLSFIPPLDPDIVTLHIFESSLPTSGFTEIDSTPAGAYPKYINQYTTKQALSLSDWFSIRWENSSGRLTDFSSPLKGGTRTLIGEIVERVLLRSPNLNENIIAQQAEAIIEWVNWGADPYLINPLSLSFTQRAAYTDLVFAACLYIDVLNRTAETRDYSAGMISERTGTSVDPRVLDSLEKMEQRALAKLGIGGSLLASIDSRILHPDDSRLSITGQKTVLDFSRLLGISAIITDELQLIDIE